MRRTVSWLVMAVFMVGGLASAGAQPAKVYPGPTPEAECGPGSKPETGMQGRVSKAETESGRAAKGYTCNTKELAHLETKGGYKVERYIDKAGNECAIYDSTLLFPKDAVDAGQDLTGVYVYDMKNPSKPVRTATLSTPAMQSPHETMVLNQKRGLLVAVTANPVWYPGFIDIYDLSKDCRQPELKSSLPVGGLGHESGMAPDGKTFYSASLSGDILTAVDISNPSAPTPIWVGQYRTHGLSISDDGNSAYLAAQPGLIILDVSEIQKRKPNPQVTEVSTLTWPTVSTPQHTIPVTIDNRPYVVEVDEFSRDDWATGAARIIDISNEKKPFVVSNIKLQVNMTDNREKVSGDPGAGSSFEDGLQGYAAHYCDVPKRNEPGVLACSFILSGLRLFDIRDAFEPKEIAYFNGPAVPADTAPTQGTGRGANYAMSKPALVPERGEIWYTDGHKGLYVVKVTNGVWPFRSGAQNEEPPDPPVAPDPEDPDREGGSEPTTGGSEEPEDDVAAERAASEEPQGAAQPFTGAPVLGFIAAAGAAIGGGALLLRLRRRG